MYKFTAGLIMLTLLSCHTLPAFADQATVNTDDVNPKASNKLRDSHVVVEANSDAPTFKKDRGIIPDRPDIDRPSMPSPHVPAGDPKQILRSNPE